MKIKKTSKYNLSDGEDEEFEGYGEGRDDFDEEVEHDSDDYVDQVNDGSMYLCFICNFASWSHI